jgi:hypothetical protein
MATMSVFPGLRVAIYHENELLPWEKTSIAVMGFYSYEGQVAYLPRG